MARRIDRLGFRAMTAFAGGGLFFSMLCLLWLLLRSGRRPWRLAYPCQRFAAAQCSWLLAGVAVPFSLRLPAGGVRVSLLLERGRPRRLAVLALGAVVATCVVAYAIPVGAQRGPSPRDHDLMAAAASALTLRPVNSDATDRSEVFAVQGLTQDKASQGVQALIGMMASAGTRFYRSARQRPDCGPDGMVASDDVVVIKVNACFDQRGMTNTDVIKGLVDAIVNHPDGFTGEVVIAENRQVPPAFLNSASKNNAVDRRQSFADVADMHAGAHRASVVDWTGVRKDVVKEFERGDERDGYVKDAAHSISYPKFTTRYGTRVSIKRGVWDGKAYDNARLKLINVPVLKSHVYAGVTDATKLYMGLWSTALTGKEWNEYHDDIIMHGGLGRVMAYGRFPCLNISDAVWSNPDLYSGPGSTYEEAVQTAKLMASTDPIALDYYASKHVLLPVSGYARHDPDNANAENPGVDNLYFDGTPCYGYPYNALHQMLSSSAAVMKAAGFHVTMDPGRISVHTARAVTLASVYPGECQNNRSAHIELGGTGLKSGARVRLERGGRPVLDATGVRVGDPRHAECDVDLDGAAPGAWDVVVENPDHATARLAASLDVGASVFYFAEGTCRPGFYPYLCIQNPGRASADVTITYMKGDGTADRQDLAVAAGSRSTVSVNDRLGTGDDPAHDFSARVECTNGARITVERPIYFDYRGTVTGGHDVMGATFPSRTWYFAEGTTRVGFDEYVTVLDPGTSAANLTFHYMVAGQGEVVVRGQVPAGSRATFKTADQVGLEKDASLFLESDREVVAERPMYFDYHPSSAAGAGRSSGGRAAASVPGAGPGWTGGHCVVGADSPAVAWYFAEGTTRSGFEEWLCLQNPGTDPIDVKATYRLGPGQGAPLTRSYTVQPLQRRTVSVNSEVGANKDVSVELTSEGGFIAERPVYFLYQGSWDGGHDVLGAGKPATVWLFAEGCTRKGFEEWLCVQNPSSEEAALEVTYFAGDGPPLTKQWKVPADARLTISVNGDVGPGRDVSARVTSSRPVIVERPMYFDYNGALTGGHDVVGYTPL